MTLVAVYSGDLPSPVHIFSPYFSNFAPCHPPVARCPWNVRHGMEGGKHRPCSIHRQARPNTLTQESRLKRRGQWCVRRVRRPRQVRTLCFETKVPGCKSNAESLHSDDAARRLWANLNSATTSQIVHNHIQLPHLTVRSTLFWIDSCRNPITPPHPVCSSGGYVDTPTLFAQYRWHGLPKEYLSLHVKRRTKPRHLGAPRRRRARQPYGQEKRESRLLFGLLLSSLPSWIEHFSCRRCGRRCDTTHGTDLSARDFHQHFLHQQYAHSISATVPLIQSDGTTVK